jgi:nucleoside-diphosphate-sugar epimerase
MNPVACSADLRNQSTVRCRPSSKAIGVTSGNNCRSRVQSPRESRTSNSGFEDMQRRVPDTTKLRSRTGWSPHHSLGEILDEMIAEAAAELAVPPDLVTS